MAVIVAREPLIVALVMALGCVPVARAEAVPLPAEVVLTLADRLVADQTVAGPSKGVWLGEESQTGTIVAGLVEAYELTCDGRYAEAAAAGAEFFSNLAGGVYLGDEGYALTRLSVALADQAGDPWLAAAEAFYTNVKTQAAGSTAGYISRFDETELSGAIFYLAHHAIAARASAAADAEVWRRGLIEYLARVDDATAQFPVMSLGLATWALASTGTLDESIIDPSGEGATYWQGRKLSDLPRLLLDHQVGSDAPLAGSFYWRFDHGSGGVPGHVSGYTEDLVFAVLALAAAGRAAPQPLTARAIEAARHVLLDSLRGTAVARQHVLDTSDSRYVYSGEVLQAVAQVVSRADLDLSGRTDNADFALWAKSWRGPGFGHGCVNSRCDFDRDGRVQHRDLMVMAREWLQ
jgi:hypothetical protein